MHRLRGEAATEALLKLSCDCPPEAVLASSSRARLQHDLDTFILTCQRLRIVGSDTHGGGRGNGATWVGVGRMNSSGCKAWKNRVLRPSAPSRGGVNEPCLWCEYSVCWRKCVV